MFFQLAYRINITGRREARVKWDVLPAGRTCYVNGHRSTLEIGSTDQLVKKRTRNVSRTVTRAPTNCAFRQIYEYVAK